MKKRNTSLIRICNPDAQKLKFIISYLLHVLRIKNPILITSGLQIPKSSSIIFLTLIQICNLDAQDLKFIISKWV